MLAEKVYASGDLNVLIPSVFKRPNPDQMLGTAAEQLVEISGRTCYNSTGTPNSRASEPFHRNLAGIDGTPPHHSVHEHFHFTIETQLHPMPWLGIPDVSVSLDVPRETYRVTANLRHCFEWPRNVTYFGGPATESLTRAWGKVLNTVLAAHMPTLIAKSDRVEVVDGRPILKDGDNNFRFVEPQTDCEAFVSLFLEDSLVWSLEQNRHRFNISQRSGRFCDQTDRADCMHPMLRDYLAETDNEGYGAFVVRNNIAALQKSQREIYIDVVDRLQNWLTAKGNVDKLTARKQARSAGRYFLGQSLSTEKIFTASIRSWRGIFKQRCNPAADLAIREIMTEAEKLVRASRWGHLL